MVVTSPHDRREPAAVASLPRFVLEAVLGSYSQILFTRSRAVGVLLLAATFVAPVQGLFGLGAVLLALSVARLFHFSSDSIRAGIFSSPRVQKDPGCLSQSQRGAQRNQIVPLEAIHASTVA